MEKRLNRIRYCSLHKGSWLLRGIYKEYFPEVLPYRIRIEVTDRCK